MRILGIDPGSRITGWGVVDSDGWELVLVAHGALRLVGTADELTRRLQAAASGLRAVISEWRPEVAAIESIFSAKSARSALVLGHARGVAMLVAAEAGLALHEYAPTQVKSSLTGYGRAEKAQVQAALATQFGLRDLPRPADAADALAIAVCHAAAARLDARLRRAEAEGVRR